MKSFKINLTKNNEEIKSEILEILPFPADIKKLKLILEEKLDTEDFLDIEEMMNEALIKLCSSRYDLGVTVSEAKRKGLPEMLIVIE